MPRIIIDNKDHVQTVKIKKVVSVVSQLSLLI